ncbi:hypothetical protein [Micromonospora sp. WMMA2032]|uniref:hypothetical protein n=1 Tax=Micromonospora sp. WMMA2032 TaxID=2039870 RepID=UPI0012FDFA82|nr:hypothetical protein [Micromonospora sp. WMMA2032]
MTWDEDRITLLLREAGDEPPRGPRVDLGDALREGRRRRRRHRGAVAGGVAVAIALAAGATPLFLRPAPPPAPSAVPPPTACTVAPLPLPEGTDGGAVSGGDRTGRWLIGSAARRGSDQQTAVLWHGDRVTELPGALRHGVAAAVNSAGTVVGAADDRAYVVRDGRVDRLPGGDGLRPTAVDDAGRVVGERLQPVGRRVRPVPVLWASATSEPVDLALPGPGWEGTAIGIAGDGTIIGTVSEEGLELTDGYGPNLNRGYRWRPDGTGEFLPMPTTAGNGARGFLPRSVGGNWLLGSTPREQPRALYAPTLLDLRTGDFVAPHTSAEFVPVAVNSRGWTVGSYGQPVAHPTGALLTGSRLLHLPAPEPGVGLRHTVPWVVSDDGRIIAGEQLGDTDADPSAVGRPIRWLCR